MLSLTFSVNIETLTAYPYDFHLVATLDEQMKVAKRLSLLSIEKLEAELHLEKDKWMTLSGTIVADVTQKCVRTLGPVPQHLEIEVDEIFVAGGQENKKEMDLDLLESAEPLEENILDLGEVVIQLLSLNLDPYPVGPESKPLEYIEENGSPSPFDILKKKDA